MEHRPHLYLVPTHSYNYFRFRGTEFHVGVVKNLYLDRKTPKLHFYLVLTHNYYYFRFCGRHASRYGEFMQNYVELHVGLCSIDFGILLNPYL